jgi:TonB family protein
LKSLVFLSINRAVHHTLIILPASIIITFLASAAFAQEARVSLDLASRPIHVTTRIFQLRTKSNSQKELTDQTFKMRTAGLSEYDKWMNAFKKAYPGYDAALLKAESRRVFRVSKPSVMTVARHSDGRSIEILLNGAQSPGDGDRPGTSLIPEITLLSGKINIAPVTYSIQQIEIENGMTYFYAINNLKMDSTDYTKFFRPNLSAESFNGNDFFLLFAYSVEIDKTVEPARYLDERQSLELQEKAVKKVIPEVPAGLSDAGVGGFIRVRVEISPEGKVTSANIQYSSFPELNHESLAAARQWEFPTTLFIDDKKPITGFIAFSLAAKSATPPAGQKAASAKPQLQ